MLFTLLTANLRRGRPVEAFRARALPRGLRRGHVPGRAVHRRTRTASTRAARCSAAVSLADDGSARVELPAQTGVVLELQDGNGAPIVTMGEEHQLGPGERISMGVSANLFDAVCGGCHGSISGSRARRRRHPGRPDRRLGLDVGHPRPGDPG